MLILEVIFMAKIGSRLMKMPENASKLVEDSREKGLGNGILNGILRFFQANADRRKEIRDEGFGFRR